MREFHIPHRTMVITSLVGAKLCIISSFLSIALIIVFGVKLLITRLGGIQVSALFAPPFLMISEAKLASHSLRS